MNKSQIDINTFELKLTRVMVMVLCWRNSRNLRKFMVAKLKKLTRVYGGETQETYESL